MDKMQFEIVVGDDWAEASSSEGAVLAYITLKMENPGRDGKIINLLSGKVAWEDDKF